MKLLPSAVSKFFRELDKRIKVLILFLGINNWRGALSRQYTQLYATALGANPVELGFLSSVGSVTASIISVPSGWLADRHGIKKVVLIGVSLSIVISAIYGFAGNWWILIPAILLSGAAQRLVMPFADIFFINLVKPQQRAMVMAFARTLWAIPRIFIPMIVAVIVTSSGGLNATGIRPIYYIQTVLGIMVFILLVFGLKITGKKKISYGKSGSFIQDLRDTFKGKRMLKRYLVLRIFRTYSLRLSMSFVPLWMVQVKGADPYILGVIGTTGTIIALLCQIPAGRLADRIGRKKAFYLFRPFTYLGTLLLITAPRPEYLILVAVLGAMGLGGGAGGGLGGLSHIPFITMQNEMVPEEKRGRWMGILGFINILSFPAPLIGGFLWQQGFMVEVLFIPVLIEALLVIPLLRTVPDPHDDF